MTILSKINNCAFRSRKLSLLPYRNPYLMSDIAMNKEVQMDWVPFLAEINIISAILETDLFSAMEG